MGSVMTGSTYDAPGFSDARTVAVSRAIGDPFADMMLEWKQDDELHIDEQQNKENSFVDID